MSSFRNNYAHVENTHRAIWPGVEIPEREPRNARKKAAAKPQRQWLAERTCTTSVLMAYFVWAISSFDRGWASRAHACKALRSLLLKLVSALGRLMLTFRPLAQFARARRALNFSSSLYNRLVPLNCVRCFSLPRSSKHGPRRRTMGGCECWTGSRD